MIFLCLGTQEFQFDRLLIEVDKLIKNGIIIEEVFAQIGFSEYIPVGFEYRDFVDFDEFNLLLAECRYVITHGGTGTIIKALKKGKKVIALPRLKKYGEHVDNHQKEIISMFSEKSLVYGLEDVSELEQAVKSIDIFCPEPFKSGNSKIISIINEFIKNCN